MYCRELTYGVIKTKDCPHDCAVDGFCAITESDIAKCEKKLRTTRIVLCSIMAVILGGIGVVCLIVYCSEKQKRY